jgi:hypothetical protein
MRRESIFHAANGSLLDVPIGRSCGPPTAKHAALAWLATFDPLP